MDGCPLPESPVSCITSTHHRFTYLLVRILSFCLSQIKMKVTAKPGTSDFRRRKATKCNCSKEVLKFEMKPKRRMLTTQIEKKTQKDGDRIKQFQPLTKNRLKKWQMAWTFATPHSSTDKQFGDIVKEEKIITVSGQFCSPIICFHLCCMARRSLLSL